MKESSILGSRRLARTRRRAGAGGEDRSGDGRESGQCGDLRPPGTPPVTSLQQLPSEANQLGIPSDADRPLDELPRRRPIPVPKPPDRASAVVFLAQIACPLQEMGGGADLGLDRTPTRPQCRARSPGGISGSWRTAPMLANQTWRRSRSAQTTLTEDFGDREGLRSWLLDLTVGADQPLPGNTRESCIWLVPLPPASHYSFDFKR
jgi:hypothetical protein